MPVDDGNSIYVGGLPYDTDEDVLRRVFSVYGSIVDIKIVNDRNVRGKCYGFITFSNPRSAGNAISGMDGKTIGGRVVRVNEVTTRGGRMNQNTGRFQHNSRDRDRDWERSYSGDRDHYSDRSRERDRSLDHYTDRERGYEHSRDDVGDKEHVSDRNRYDERKQAERVGKHSQDHEHYSEREHNVYGNQRPGFSETNEYQRSMDREIDQDSRREKREFFSNSNEDYSFQVEEELEGFIHRREELQKEVLIMEDRFEEKQRLVSNLRKQSKRLEEALIDAKKLTSKHKKQLSELYTCFKQATECTEKLKSSEQKLQSLVDSTMREGHMDTDFGTKDGHIGNGYASLSP